MTDNGALVEQIKGVLTEARDTFRDYAGCLGKGDALLFAERAVECDRALLLLQNPKQSRRIVERVGERVTVTKEYQEMFPGSENLRGTIYSQCKTAECWNVKFDGQSHITQDIHDTFLVPILEE